MSKSELIQDFIETLTSDEGLKMISLDGGVSPMFVFLIMGDDGVVRNTTLDIPKEFMDKGRAGKEVFMTQVFPRVKEHIRNDGHEIIAIAFICEAWKSADKEMMNSDIEFNETNSEEIIMFDIHYTDNKITFIYPMIRKGGKLTFGKKEVKQTAYSEDTYKGRFSELMS